jgi:hypothetical protein
MSKDAVNAQTNDKLGHLHGENEKSSRRLILASRVSSQKELVGAQQLQGRKDSQQDEQQVSPWTINH